MRSSRGFTLVELMIVVATIAILASIAVPNLLAARLQANETSALSCLRGIASAQCQFQVASKADSDRDGMGEYGLLREMSGAIGVRADVTASVAGLPVNPSVLSTSFRLVNAQGEVVRAGYHYRLFLPGVNGVGVGETGVGAPLGAAVDADLAEGAWTCYAWPAYRGVTGFRTFVISQNGDLSANTSANYSSASAINEANCGVAFMGAGPMNSITGTVAMGTRGRDGWFWKSAR